MSDESGTLSGLLKAFARALKPLEEALATPEATLELLATLGVNAPIAPPALLQLRAPVVDVSTGVTQLVQVITAEGEGSEAALGKLGELSIRTAFAAERIVSLAPRLEADLAAYPAVLAQIDFADVALRLLDFLLIEVLRREFPTVYGVLLLLGIVHVESIVPGDADAEAVYPHQRAELRWGRLEQLIQRPAELARDVYGWGTDDLAHHEILERLRFLLQSTGYIADFHDVSDAAGIAAAGAELRLPIYTDITEDGSLTVAVGIVPLVPAATGQGSRLAVRPTLTGSAHVEFELRPALTLALKAAFDVEAPFALVLAPPGDLSLALGLGGQSATFVATVDWGRESGARLPLVVIPTWLTLDAAGIRATVTLAVGPAGLSPAIEAGFVDTKLKIDGSKADGFLKKVLPDKAIEATFDAVVGWSSAKGLYLGGGGGSAGTIAVSLPLHLSILGVITLETLHLSFAMDGEKARTTVAADILAKIGPVSASVERIGARIDLGFQSGGRNLGLADLALAFKPPNGAGLSVKAGPITGGGYLFFDPENEQYAGVLELSFKAISITAIGLLTTRLPDASGPPGATKKGFSLLVIIAVELPPIQLGYGFTLNGVGGLLGIHRTMMVEPLRSGVRDGTVNSILFPKDVVARAPQIISQLKSIFPPAEGRYVFGPMVKIGWGPNAILELEAALVLELMAPIRLVILGRIQVALPDKKDPVLNLRLDIVGVVDFDKGEISVDASLVDSRLVVFVLTGDMALRVGWGASKLFALAAGGFHPAFQPPPGFPALRRLAIALADSDNPRLRLETYLALTSNTVQLGAALDAYAKVDTFVGKFSVSANLGFDALIQFQPFELTAALGAQVDIARDDVPVLHAAVHACLTGPTPWHLVGYAEFDFFGRHRIDVVATIGSPAAPPELRVEAADVLAHVVEAFSKPDAWAALPPRDADRVAGTADQSPSGAIVVHPLGALSARQRLVPFGTYLDRFGAAVLAPTTFTLTGFRVGSGQSQSQAADLYDDFSPGQFKALTDDERVARPAFESMRSGGHVAVAAFRLPADLPAGVTSTGSYQEAAVDVEPGSGYRSAGPLPRRKGGRGVKRTLPANVVTALTAAGAAARAETRSTGARQFRGPDLFVAVRAERWVAADTDTLDPLAAAAPESSSEAHDRLAALGPTAAGQVALVHEAA